MLDYNKLMEQGPTEYSLTITNSLQQKINFIEHPTKGDESPVIAVCHALKLADYTTFWDLGDFYEGSEYNPVFITKDKCVCEFEVGV